MVQINLPTDLLRTFITVSDLGSYTKAGNALGRTQPTISLQIRRLEQLVDETLIVHEGRISKLTEAGKLLEAYARQILHMNDEAVSRFRRVDAVGPVRIGLPTDFALTFLQDAITQFSREHTDVDLEIHCGLSQDLLGQLQSDKLDLTVALIADGNQQCLVRVWEERPIWTAAQDASFVQSERVPLVGHPEGCEYRRRMIDALERAGRDWRVAYTSPNITGLQDAVIAGLGVSALTQATFRDGMRVLSEADGFPELKKIRIGLFYKLPRLSPTGLTLSHHVIAKLDEATDSHFTSARHP